MVSQVGYGFRDSNVMIYELDAQNLDEVDEFLHIFEENDVILAI